MALTPDDITQKFFATRFRGVDPEEVKEFLGLVAAQLTELQDRLRYLVYQALPISPYLKLK